jgi:hypothetical protein
MQMLECATHENSLWDVLLTVNSLDKVVTLKDPSSIYLTIVSPSKCTGHKIWT